MSKILSKLEDKIGILGQNILINNDTITAFYLLDCINYSVMSDIGKEKHISSLENMFTTLATQRPGTKFSILSVNKVLTVEDIERNLIDTVRLWDPSYKQIPEIFRNYIENNNETIVLLAVNIETKDSIDVESVTIKGLMNDFLNYMSREFFSLNRVNIDAARILGIEKNIYDIISNYVVRASRELTFYTYVSSLYPSYEISYNKNSFVEKNTGPILGAIGQEIKSNFGYFEMSNSGVEMFGMEAQTTYGSILKIIKFPDLIDSNNFNLNIPNLRVNVQTISKDKAKLKIKRSRADLEFEMETASDAGARDLGELDDKLDTAEHALNLLANGGFIVDMEVNILILAKTLEELKSFKQRIITSLGDINIIATISPDQGKDFVNNYLKLNPGTNEYTHLTELRFPLSFQLNNATRVGDFDSRFAAPAIGTEIVK